MSAFKSPSFLKAKPSIRAAITAEIGILTDMCYLTKRTGFKDLLKVAEAEMILSKCDSQERISICTHRLKRDVETFDQWVAKNLTAEEIAECKAAVEAHCGSNPETEPVKKQRKLPAKGETK